MGRFFDVTYVNYVNPKFNPHRHYAFLRSYDDVTLLIVVNFDQKASEVEINIPQHAFDLLDMPQGIVKATRIALRHFRREGICFRRPVQDISGRSI